MSPTEGIGSNSQLLKLPNELFLEAASYLEGFKDLNSLARTSRFLHTIFNTHLYRRAVAADDIVLDDILRWVLSGYRLASLTLLLDNGLSVNHTGQFAYDKQCEGLGMYSWHADTMLLFLSLLDDKKRSVPLARLLIQRGAHIDATGDKYSRTVLQKAISHGNCPIVALLLAHGADVNAADNAGLRAMHFVCDNLSYCAEIAHSLMAHRADVTVAHNAVLRALRDKFNDSAEIVHLLIAHGADIEARSASGDTPLIRSSQYSPRVMAALLEHGADAGVHNNRGETPLHYASRWFEDEHYELAKSLLENGAKINATDQAGKRALHWLLESHPGDPLFMAKFLLENGADVNAISDEGLSPLHSAAECQDRVDVVELLLEHGAIINATDPSGLTSLHYLLSYSPGDANELVAIADVLLKNGADVNAVCDEGFSPLQRALDIGCEAELVRLLLAHSADVSVLDSEYRSELSRVMGEQTPSMNGN